MATRHETDKSCGIPSERDAELADRAARALDALIDSAQPVSARFGNETVALPAAALRLLREILGRMAQGKGVALTPLDAEDILAWRREALDGLTASDQKLGLQ